MDNNPLYSVIIPAYNSESTIAGCVDSLSKQSLSSDYYEIIVVDDGSVDSTGRLAQEHKARVIKQGHYGPAQARNTGIRESRGEILVFIDSDCVADSQFMEKICSRFKDKNIVGVQGAYKTRQRGIIARFVQLEIEQRYEMMRKLKSIDFIGSYAAAYRKEVFLRAGYFDTCFHSASGEDADFSFRLSRLKDGLIFEKDAIVYHKHPQTLALYLKQKFLRAYWCVLLYSRNRDKIIKDAYTPQILKIQILIALGIAASIVSSGMLGKAAGAIIVAQLLAFFLSSLSLALFALKTDMPLAFFIPFFSFMRSVSFLLGLFCGVVNLAILKAKEALKSEKGP